MKIGSGKAVAGGLLAVFIGAGAGLSAPEAGREMLQARFQAVVYEFRGSVGTNGLEAAALARQGDSEEALLKALGGEGQARLLYRLDLPVNVFGEKIVMGSSEPIVTGSQLSANGPASQRITYRTLGLIARLSAQWSSSETNRDHPLVEINLLLPAVTNKANQLSSPARPDWGPLSLAHTERLAFGRPVVLMGKGHPTLEVLSNLGVDPPAPALYVLRYTLSEPIEPAGVIPAPVGKTGPGEAEPKSTGAEVGAEAAGIPAEFEATVYEVKADVDHAKELEASALMREMGTPETLLKALGRVGGARRLYQVEQKVDVSSAEILLRTNEPVAIQSQVNRQGHVVNTTSYRSTGLNIQLSASQRGKAATADGTEVAMTISLSGLAPAAVDLGPEVPASATKTLAITHQEPLRYGQPRLMVFTRAASGAEHAQIVAGVVQYTFKVPSAPGRR